MSLEHHKKLTLRISGMSCVACASLIETELNKTKGVLAASINFTAERGSVKFDREQIGAASLIERIERLGYRANIAQGQHEGESSSPSASYTRFATARLVSALVLSTVVMILGTLNQWPWSQMLLTIIVITLVGIPFYQRAIKGLRHRTATMDTLVSLGTTAAFGYSVWALFTVKSHLYFDSAAFIISLISLGKFLEGRARRNTAAAVEMLLAHTPSSVKVIKNHTEQSVPLTDVRVGDTVIVRAGERIAVDGIVTHGNASVDESLITGESIYVEKKTGDEVVGGTFNQDGLLHIEAKRIGAESKLAHIARLVEEAQTSKPKVQHLADRVTAIFVPIVIIIATATLVIWGVVVGDWTRGLLAAASTLVIACPCAIGIATPAAIMVAIGKGANMGILIRNAQTLENAGPVDCVVLDKTGTLTKSELHVTNVSPEINGLWGMDNNTAELLRFAAGAESVSTHPIATAIVNHARYAGVEVPTPQDAQAISGWGVQAIIDGYKVAVANPQQLGCPRSNLSNRHFQPHATQIGVTVDNNFAGTITVAEELKTEAQAVISEIKHSGQRVVMLTGDSISMAKQVASKLGCEDFKAQILPSGKAKVIANLQAEGARVAMVGDGVNDAPALAQADVGIAMGTGADIAMESADITLLSNDLTSIPKIFLLSHETLKTIKQNLFWAFFYNIVMIPLASSGLLNPKFAATAMVLSSLSVLTNALILHRKRL